MWVNLPIFVFLAVASIALFTFLAVTTFVEQRTKERVAYHRFDALKKVAESSGNNADRVLDILDREERLRSQRMLEGLKLGGLITAGAGAGVLIFLHYLDAGQPRGVELAGLIPLLIGLAMLIYATLLAAKPGDSRP
jgi:hypothetical protein